MALPFGRNFSGAIDEETIPQKRMEKSIVNRDYHVFLRLLKTMRREANMTQEELGGELGQTQSFVSKVERGERRLDVVETRHFCRAMQISFKDFIARLEQMLSSPESTPDTNNLEDSSTQSIAANPDTNLT